MSDFEGFVKFKKDGDVHPARFVDDYFGLHRYGIMVNGNVYRDGECEFLPPDRVLKVCADGCPFYSDSCYSAGHRKKFIEIGTEDE